MSDTVHAYIPPYSYLPSRESEPPYCKPQLFRGSSVPHSEWSRDDSTLLLFDSDSLWITTTPTEQCELNHTNTYPVRPVSTLHALQPNFNLSTLFSSAHHISTAPPNIPTKYQLRHPNSPNIPSLLNNITYLSIKYGVMANIITSHTKAAHVIARGSIPHT
ncbi:hypothetical protein BDQ17DRAFT_551606 [Cyathus striatus]|nr:hypothetical protein BDQ17DRAFT_551606 [Cyathus striatus]